MEWRHTETNYDPVLKPLVARELVGGPLDGDKVLAIRENTIFLSPSRRGVDPLKNESVFCQYVLRQDGKMEFTGYLS